MGLTLTRKSGTAIIIDDKKLSVIDIKPKHVMLEFQDDRFKLDFYQEKYLFGSVAIKVCGGNHSHQVKITVDAPRSVRVDREEIYNKKMGIK